jgi:hypothetical protein
LWEHPYEARITRPMGENAMNPLDMPLHPMEAALLPGSF